MDNNNLQSGFTVNNLLLIESSFKRISQVQFDEKAKSNLNISTDVNVCDGKIINVIETVKFNQVYNGIEQFSFFVKMVGIFENIGESEIKDYEVFGKVNGAAIIFPYIREHITNIALKAGLGAIILPPINFTKTMNKTTATTESK